VAEPRVVSFSEADTAKQCPLKHQLSYVERWTSDPEVDSPLAKGTAWHLAHEWHYRTIKQHQDRADELGEQVDERAVETDCRATVARVIDTRIAPQSSELADLIDWMYQGHIHHYGIDPQWRVLAVEHAAQCRLPTSTGRPSGFVLKMKIDLIVAEGRGVRPPIWIVDAKSCRNLPKGKDHDFDDQFGLYTWGMRRLGKSVFGQIHSAARTERLVKEAKAWRAENVPPEPYVPGEVQPMDQRFKRSRMYRTDVELDTLAVEMWQVMRTRYDQQRAATRAGIDSPRHTNPDTCSWRCPYTEPCLAGRKGVDMRQYLRDKGFQQDFTRN